MNRSEIQAFKNNLENIKPFMQEIEKRQSEIVTLKGQKYGIKARDIVKIPDNTNPKAYPYDLLDKLDEEIERKEKEIDHFYFIINLTKSKLDSIPDKLVKDALVMIYVNGKSWKETADKLSVDKSTISRQIDICLKDL